MPTSAPTTPWAPLLPVALGGTRRQPFAPLPGLSPPLGSETDAPEKQLLLTAANLALVQRAGQRPAAGPATRSRVPPEHWPAAPPAAAALLAAALARAPYSTTWGRALVGGLERLHAARRRLPYRLLPSLLDTLAQFYRAGQLARYAPVVGQLGRELVRRHPGVEVRGQARLLPEPATAALDSALLVAEECRQAGPASLARVLAALPRTEPELRPHLLELLVDWSQQAPLPLEVEPALLALLPDAANHWDIHRLLVATPGTELGERLWAQSRPYLTVQRDAAGNPRLHIERPDTVAMLESPFFLPGNTRNASGWLVNHQSLVPPRRWLTDWQLPAAEAVALAASSYEGQTLLSYWQYAASLHRDYDLAPLLYAHALTRGLNHVGAELLQLLPEATQVEWAQACLPGPGGSDLPKNGICVVWNWQKTRQPALLRALQGFTQAWLHAPTGPLPDEVTSLVQQFLDQLDYQGDPALLPFVAGLLGAPQAAPLAVRLDQTHQLLTYYRDLADSLVAG